MNELVPGIMHEVLSPNMFGKGLLSGWSRIQRLRSNFQQPIVSLGCYGRNIHRKKLNLNPEHRLLQYVIEYWLSHTADLKPDSDLWDLFQSLVLDKRLPFDFRPWKEVSPGRQLPYLPAFYWAFEEGNVALLSILMSQVDKLESYCNHVFREGHVKTSILLSTLGIALKRGHLHIWEILLAQVPEFCLEAITIHLEDLNASEKDEILLLAVEEGHLEITRCLVLGGAANLDLRNDCGLSPVGIASARGHMEIANLLQPPLPASPHLLPQSRLKRGRWVGGSSAI